MKHLSRLFKAKLVCAVFAIGLLSNTAKSQDYYHGLGIQIDVGSYKVSLENDSSGIVYGGDPNLASVPGIFYKATLLMSENIAVSGYPFLGLAFEANSRTGSSGAFGIQIPVVAEFVLGDLDDGCFYAGAGFAFSYISTSYATAFGNYSTSGTAIGPQLSLGGQFTVRDQLYGLRASYLIGLNKAKDIPEGYSLAEDKRGVFSIGVYYPFGQ